MPLILQYKGYPLLWIGPFETKKHGKSSWFGEVLGIALIFKGKLDQHIFAAR